MGNPPLPGLRVSLLVHSAERDPTRRLRRINELIRDALRTPYHGLGKPEPLKHTLNGSWASRINHEHRLVYLG
jgi:Txe/YoeB family toxin of toxin-antitoxin system